MAESTENGSRDVARAALALATTRTREEETALRETQKDSEGILSAAADYGGDFNLCATKVIERIVVAARRENVIDESHHEQGAVAGAAHDALSQLIPKALGLSVGGKVAVARKGEHVAVVVFFCVGLGHLNEVTVGLGHRALE